MLIIKEQTITSIRAVIILSYNEKVLMLITISNYNFYKIKNVVVIKKFRNENASAGTLYMYYINTIFKRT